MKLHYIGVRSAISKHLPNDMLTAPYQIIKNESKPSHELCAEKELTAYSRFTRNRYAVYYNRVGNLWLTVKYLAMESS